MEAASKLLPRRGKSAFFTPEYLVWQWHLAHIWYMHLNNIIQRRRVGIFDSWKNPLGPWMAPLATWRNPVTLKLMKFVVMVRMIIGQVSELVISDDLVRYQVSEYLNKTKKGESQVSEYLN